MNKRRRAREKMRGRKGIIVEGMILGLLMGCNNGLSELEKEKESILSISKLRQGFLDVFATFGGMVSDVLGIKAETTKKQVGEELGKVGKAVETVKGKLEALKLTENYNSIKDKADTIITNAINTLGTIVSGANKIKDAAGSSADKVGGNVSDSENAEPADTESVKNLIAGINMIFEAANDAKISASGDASKEIDASQEVGKLLNDTGTANQANALKGAR